MTGEEFAKEHDEVNRVYGHDDLEFQKHIGALFERFVDARIQIALAAYEPPKSKRRPAASS